MCYVGGCVTDVERERARRVEMSTLQTSPLAAAAPRAEGTPAKTPARTPAAGAAMAAVSGSFVTNILASAGPSYVIFIYFSGHAGQDVHKKSFHISSSNSLVLVIG